MEDETEQARNKQTEIKSFRCSCYFFCDTSCFSLLRFFSTFKLRFRRIIYVNTWKEDGIMKKRRMSLRSVTTLLYIFLATDQKANFLGQKGIPHFCCNAHTSEWGKGRFTYSNYLLLFSFQKIFFPLLTFFIMKHNKKKRDRKGKQNYFKSDWLVERKKCVFWYRRFSL